ncbi:hypothetical protein IFR05_013016 [Cadophora sp. M221]|nr:hypothetical protein IFR05_013016 [Cadophora sp. M221]
MSDDEAATLPTNTIASLVSFFSSLNGLGILAPWSVEAKDFDYASTTVLIIGGGSNCGKFRVQLAKLAGIGTIVVVGGVDIESKIYGATHVLDRHGEYNEVLEWIRTVVGDDLQYAFDAINAPPGQILALNALSNTKKGTLARLVLMGPVDESMVVGKNAGFKVKDVMGSSQLHP